MSDDNTHLTAEEIIARANRRKAIPEKRCGSCADLTTHRGLFWCGFLCEHTSLVHVCNEWSLNEATLTEEREAK